MQKANRFRDDISYSVLRKGDSVAGTQRIHSAMFYWTFENSIFLFCQRSHTRPQPLELCEGDGLKEKIPFFSKPSNFWTTIGFFQ